MLPKAVFVCVLGRLQASQHTSTEGEGGEVQEVIRGGGGAVCLDWLFTVHPLQYTSTTVHPSCAEDVAAMPKVYHCTCVHAPV
jgi:hypothetical protein